MRTHAVSSSRCPTPAWRASPRPLPSTCAASRNCSSRNSTIKSSPFSRTLWARSPSTALLAEKPRRMEMNATMRAVVLDAPGPPEALQIRELPLPEPRPGWVLIRVKAFGINRSELHTRLGLAQGVTFPRVLGIEATGVVAAAPGGEFEEGQQVAAILAKDRGLTVLSTTRQPDRVASLEAIGVDHVLVDDGDVAAQTRAIVPDGVEAALELVGTNTLPDTLRATAVHGVVCFTGMLSNQWTVADFYPIEYIPSGVRLTAYGGDAADLPADVLQGYLDAVAAGRLTVPIHHTYALDEIAQAHADMEHGRATGKLVVLP